MPSVFLHYFGTFLFASDPDILENALHDLLRFPATFQYVRLVGLGV